MKRNLHYFIFPLRGSIWGWNVDQLRPFLPAFNGRKFVTVAEGPDTDPFEEVAARFDDPEVHFVRKPNDRESGQLVGFLEVMERLRSEDPDEMTFYAHARGVSHWMPTVACVMAHTEAMYQICLGRIDLVERLMARHAVVGAFRQPNGDGSSWLFAGGFYWFKHSEMFRRDWTSVPQNRYGVEDYPARHFRKEESFNLTFDRPFPDMYQNVIPRDTISGVLKELPEAVDRALEVKAHD